MRLRRCHVVVEKGPSDDMSDVPAVREVLRGFAGQRAEFRARQFVARSGRADRLDVIVIFVEEFDARPKKIDKLYRLPMDKSFDDLEIVGTTCIMGTITQIKVQTPDGELYRTPITAQLRSELTVLPSVKRRRISARSVSRRAIHDFFLKEN